MQKVSSSLIRSISASQLLKGDAQDGQVLGYSDALATWLPVDQTGGTGTGTSPSNDSQLPLIQSSIGQAWDLVSNTANASNWSRISISSGGRYQTVVGNLSSIITSSDYGSSWTTSTSPTSSVLWTAVDVSGDGKYQIATTNQYLYVSDDFGNAWERKFVPNSSARNWSGVQISYDGRIQIGCIQSIVNGYIYMSTDYGNTWEQVLEELGPKNWISIAMSSNGKYILAVASASLLRPYRSADGGLTWNPIIDEHISTIFGGCLVDMSDDGKYQTLIKYGEPYLHTSSNYGVTWIKRDIDTGKPWWTSLSVSGNGKIQVITTEFLPSLLYLSLDAGVNWRLVETPIQFGLRWVDNAISSDGKVLVALEKNTGVYRSFADNQFNGNLYVSDSVRAARIYGTFYGDASNLVAPGVGIAGTVTSLLTGNGSTKTFSISSLYNGLDLGRYMVSVGGLDQPSSFWTVDSTNGGRMTLVEAPRAGELISIRSVVGNGYPTLYSFRSTSIGYGVKILVTTTNWNSYEPGIFITAFAGPNSWMSGKVTNVTLNSATVSINSIAGSGTFSNWTIRYGSSLNISSTIPNQGQSLIFNGAEWVPGVAAVDATTLGGYPISIGVPSPSEALTWNGTTWTNAQPNAFRLQSYDISPQAPNPGQALAWDSYNWIPTDVDAVKIRGNYVADIPPGNGNVLVWNLAYNYWEPLDITATNATQLQSRDILDARPATGQPLVWNDMVEFWEPGIPLSADSIKIWSRNIADIVPSNDQVLTWKQSNNQWEPGTPSTNAESLRGNTVSAGTPSSNQSLVWNGIITQWEPGFPLSADSIKLHSRSVASTAPSEGQALVWSNSNNQWQPGTATFSADADLIRGYPVVDVPPVDKQTLIFNGVSWEPGTAIADAQTLQTRDVSEDPPEPGEVLTWDGVTQKWSPLPPTGGGSGNATQIQSRAVSSAAPLDGQVLSWNATTSAWEPRGGGGSITFNTQGTHLWSVPAGVRYTSVTATAGAGEDGTATNGQDGQAGQDEYFNTDTQTWIGPTTGDNGANGTAAAGMDGKTISIPALSFSVAGGAGGTAGQFGYGGGGSGGGSSNLSNFPGANGASGSGSGAGGGGTGATSTSTGSGGLNGGGTATDGFAGDNSTGGAGGTGGENGGNGGAGGSGSYGGGGGGGATSRAGGGGGAGGYGGSGLGTAGVPGKGGIATAGGTGQPANTFTGAVNFASYAGGQIAVIISPGAGDASITITW